MIMRARTGIGIVLWTLAGGTAHSQDCHPSYDPCVPVARDVDCAGGRGDGPEYIMGPIRVIGVDTYGLDRDGDGIACEPK